VQAISAATTKQPIPPLTALMVGVVTVATVPDSDIMGILRSTGGELHPRPQPTSAA
jgi:hypothetical protein